MTRIGNTLGTKYGESELNDTIRLCRIWEGVLAVDIATIPTCNRRYQDIMYVLMSKEDSLE